jgi:hypothetical protein
MDDNACSSPPLSSTEETLPAVDKPIWSILHEENISKSKKTVKQKSVLKTSAKGIEKTKKPVQRGVLKELEKKAIKALKGEEEEIITNLLLSYTYFLDRLGLVHISCGFHSATFEPIFVIRACKKEISFNKVDWYSFYISLQNHTGGDLKINDDFCIGIGKEFVTIQSGKTKIVLKEGEWKVFKDMVQLFHKYMIFYICTSSYISSYVKLYIEKCVASGVSSLPFDSFFSPNFETPFNINWNRLFYEIPIFCKTKIDKNIFFTLFNFDDV